MGFQIFCQPNPFDINYLLKVPPDILSKYLNNLMEHLHILISFKVSVIFIYLLLLLHSENYKNSYNFNL